MGVDVERGVLKAMQELELNPVLRAYGTGGAFSGNCTVTIYIGRCIGEPSVFLCSPACLCVCNDEIKF